MEILRIIWNGLPNWMSLLVGITGLAALTISLKVFRKDKSKLEVNANVGKRRNSSDQPLKWCLEVILRNKGRRPCYVDHVSLELPVKLIKYGDIELTPAGPIAFNLFQGSKKGMIELGESQKHSIVIPDFSEDLLMSATRAGKGIGTLLVVDSLGRKIRHKFNLPVEDLLRSKKTVTQ